MNLHIIMDLVKSIRYYAVLKSYLKISFYLQTPVCRGVASYRTIETSYCSK